MQINNWLIMIALQWGRGSIVYRGIHFPLSHFQFFFDVALNYLHEKVCPEFKFTIIHFIFVLGT